MAGVDPRTELTPPAEPITGDSHHHLIARLIAHAAQLGYTVEIRELPEHGPGGWCDAKRRQIVVANGPGNQQVRTLTHELAHAHGVGYQQYPRAQAEVLVDCVTYCVLGSVGLDVGGESIPYIAVGGRTARSMPSAVARRRSTRSPEASKTPSTRRPNRPMTQSRLKPSPPPERRRSVGGCGAPMIGRARPADVWCDVRQRRRAPDGLTRNGAHAAPGRHPTP